LSPSRASTWWRPEPFGAWTRLQDGTLIAVDHALRARLGLDPDAPPAAVTLPLEAHLAVTRRCDAGCLGCYQDAGSAAPEPDRAQLSSTLEQAAKHGVATVAFGGGEPTLRADLSELAIETSDLGMTPVTTTNGRQVDAAMARRLRSFAQINVSHDGVRGGYLRVRGHDGSAQAERAIALLADAGVRTGVNTVVTRENLDGLQATADRAMELGAVEMQLIRYKPSGRGERRYAECALGPERVGDLASAIQALCRLPGLSIRVDCSMVPLLAPTLPAAREDLQKLGVFGCEAGRYLAGLGWDGAWKPCSCWPQAAGGDWGTGPDLSAVRGWHRALSGPCTDCGWARVCRGGCQVVSMHVRGRMGPDPECSLVRNHPQS
jgi:radical SAM protein with 4Fe4S-binding SPASM domain